jgi:allantoinase
VIPASEFPADTPYTDYSPNVLLPGLVDAHVHLNEPGRTEWEGFYTGTQAAAFGGVTTVIDMPLNAIPPTTTVAGLKEKLDAASGKCWVDVGFYGGIIPGNAHELKGLVQEGVRGFKGFLIDSGVSDHLIPMTFLAYTNLLHCRLMSSPLLAKRISRRLWLNLQMSPRP